MIANKLIVRGMEEPHIILPKEEKMHGVGNSEEPAFENSWINYTTPGAHHGANFYKDALGYVHIHMLVKNGTSYVVFTLPPSYRPSEDKIFTVYTDAGISRLNVYDDGRVFCYRTGTVLIYVSLMFLADNRKTYTLGE